MLQWIKNNLLSACASTVLFGFVSGVFLRSLYFVPFATSVFAGCICLIFLVAFLYKRRNSFLLVALLLASTLCGVIRTEIALPRLGSDYESKLGTEYSFDGIVIAPPDLRESSQRITVRRADGQRILVVAPLYPRVTYGSTISAKGILERPVEFQTEGERIFRYDNFLAKDKIYLTLKGAKITNLSERSGIQTFLPGIVFDSRDRFIQGIETALSEPGASLAVGMLLGGKQGLGTELLNAFIVTGLVHIVVLSGYNIAIVAEAVLRMTTFLGRKRSAVFAGIVIVLFVIAAGASAASLRAGIMAVIAVFARATYRTYDALRALAFAAVCMILVSPLTLLYDPGFQLSVVATLGLIILSPKIDKFFGWIKLNGLREVLVSTVAAQVAVLPLLLYMTGLFSWTALPANIVVLPIVPLAMGLSMIAGISGVFMSQISTLISLPAHFLLTYVTSAAAVLSDLPYSKILIPAYGAEVLVPIYLVLVSLFFWPEFSQNLHKLLK